MVSSVASFGGLSQPQALTARALTPAPVAPAQQDQPRRPAALTVASAVAFAPAAMTALIEAQERLSEDAPRVVRQDTAQKIDHLIASLDAGSAPAAHAEAPFAVRQLIVARQALSASLIDLQA